ncbi:hypothetical protein SCALM49S_00974 [Streptomyces californicus]
MTFRSLWTTPGPIPVPGTVCLSPASVAATRKGREDRHDRGSDEAWEGGAPDSSGSAQDLDAEQSVLGGMLLSKDAIAEVVEVIKGHDFYRPAHETVFTAILDLYAKGDAPSCRPVRTAGAWNSTRGT